MREDGWVVVEGNSTKTAREGRREQYRKEERKEGIIGH